MNKILPKTIIFDFDGTIADSMEAVRQIYNRIAVEKGFKLITEKNMEILRDKNPREILKALGLSIFQVARFGPRVRNELRNQVKDLKIFPGVKGLVLKIKDLDYRLGIITSNSEENVREFLKRNNIDIFDFIYAGNSIFGKTKTLKLLMKQQTVTPQQLIFIADEVRDIESARKAGVKIVCISWGYNTPLAFEHNHPDALVNNTNELFEAIKTI